MTKPNFNYRRSIRIDSVRCIAVSRPYYAYTKELEIQIASQDFKLAANKLLLYKADSLIFGLESNLDRANHMIALSNREAIACRNTMDKQTTLLNKHRSAIKNLERMNKIHRRRVRVIAGVGAVAVVSAVILSFVK